MTVTQVRLLSDGEELVIEEGRWPSSCSSEPPPREALFARRSQAISDDDRLVLRRLQARALPPFGKKRPPDRGHRNMAADTASRFVTTDQRLRLGKSATEATGLTPLDVERSGSMTDEGGALAAIIESAHVDRKAL